MSHTDESYDPRLYQIPTHLQQQDTFVFSFFIFTLTVTTREGLILLVGWSSAFQLWHQLIGLTQMVGPAGILLQWGIVLLWAVVALLVAKLKIADRYLEEWLRVLLRYRQQPRLLLWRASTSIMRDGGDPLSRAQPAPQEDAQ